LSQPECIDFVPARYVDECRALAAAEPPPAASLLGIEFPFPDIARVFYTRGGCWNLALALHAATGLAIEVGYQGSVPRHAYVTDETDGVDAFGPKPVRLARMGFDKVRRVSPAELLDELARMDDGEDLVAEVERDDMRVCAEAAAKFLLAEYDWQGASS
jgi:hypothetical protein